MQYCRLILCLFHVCPRHNGAFISATAIVTTMLAKGLADTVRKMRVRGGERIERGRKTREKGRWMRDE